MRPNPAAADTIRTLIAAVPDDRLRELFLELALAALAVPAVEEPKPAARNGRRRRGRGKGWRHGKGRHKIDRHRRAYLDALNAKRREERRLAREAGQAAGTARRRGRKPKGNGAENSRQRRYCLRQGAGSTPGSSNRGSPGAQWYASLVSATGRPVRSPQSSHATERQPRGRGPIPHTVKMGSFAKFHSRFQGTTGAVAGLVPVANDSLAHAAEPWRDTPESKSCGVI